MINPAMNLLQSIREDIRTVLERDHSLKGGMRYQQRIASPIGYLSTHQSEAMTAASQTAPTKYPAATSLG